MLYVIHMGNHPELTYRGGQSLLIHLEADLRRTVAWADARERRWAFTTGNAAARLTEDYSDLRFLENVDWPAVQATNWAGIQDRKQAEYLLEYSFPWDLVERIGVHSRQAYNAAVRAVRSVAHQPPVEVRPEWYY